MYFVDFFIFCEDIEFLDLIFFKKNEIKFLYYDYFVKILISVYKILIISISNILERGIWYIVVSV